MSVNTFSIRYRSIKQAARNAAKRPVRTGARFLRASSTGLTLQMAATGISPQGTMVPPPTKIAPICPNAARIGTEAWVAAPKVCARAPVRGRPEKPEPSRPVRQPIKS